MDNINDFVGGYDNTYTEDIISGYTYDNLLDELLDEDIGGGYEDEYGDGDEYGDEYGDGDEGSYVYDDLITTTSNNYIQKPVSVLKVANKTGGNVSTSSYDEVANYLTNYMQTHFK